MAAHQRAPGAERVLELRQQPAHRVRVERGEEQGRFRGAMAAEDQRQEPGRERAPPGLGHVLEEPAADEGGQLREEPLEGGIVLEVASRQGGGPRAHETGGVGETSQQHGLVARAPGQLEREVRLVGIAGQEPGHELRQRGAAPAIASQPGDPREPCSVAQRVQLRQQRFARRYLHGCSLPGAGDVRPDRAGARPRSRRPSRARGRRGSGGTRSPAGRSARCPPRGLHPREPAAAAFPPA